MLPCGVSRLRWINSQSLHYMLRHMISDIRRVVLDELNKIPPSFFCAKYAVSARLRRYSTWIYLKYTKLGQKGGITNQANFLEALFSLYKKNINLDSWLSSRIVQYSSLTSGTLFPDTFVNVVVNQNCRKPSVFVQSGIKSKVQALLVSLVFVFIMVRWNKYNTL